MDLIGETASVSQLVAYGGSVARCLLRLSRAIRHGPAAYRDQELNVSILLDIVQRVRWQERLQAPITRLLQDISELAWKIQEFLRQRGFLGLNWSVIARSEAVSEAFAALNTKKDLLHLHISERSQVALNQIQSDINRIIMPSRCSERGPKSAPMESTQSRPTNRENEKSNENDKKGPESKPSNIFDLSQMKIDDSSTQEWANGREGSMHVNGTGTQVVNKSKSIVGNMKLSAKEEGFESEAKKKAEGSKEKENEESSEKEAEGSSEKKDEGSKDKET
ncbi:MAG: hypothetical protein M1822_005482 [Bathelium mastoideum]|nr:MAG: hypothetical protein M1822_005482 [Bathelium mastoideum]